MPATTLRLFDQNPYQTKARAKVRAAHHLDGKTGLVLDKTLFYPEAGGQPSDQGMIREQPVLAVSEQDAEILHLVHQPIEVGEIVTLELDWTVRFDHMQQHSAQHLLSQCFFQRHRAETTGFHLGKTFSTIDLNRSDFTDGEMEAMEIMANTVIHENRPIRVYHATESEAAGLPLRKHPDDLALIRVVEIQDFDWSACCGTHVKHTGELGLLRILKWERYKGGTRVYFTAGMRAYAQVQGMARQMRESAAALSVGEDALSEAVQRLREDHKQASREIRQLSRELIRFEAESMLQNADNLGRVRYIEASWERDERGMVNNLVQTLIASAQVLVFMRVQNRQQLIIGKSRSVVLDLSALLQDVFTRFQGRGGGSAEMIQMVFEDRVQFHRAIEYLKNQISHSLVT